MKYLMALVLLVLTLTTGVVVQAQTLEQSIAASQCRDDRAAFAGFKQLAEKGNAAAQFYLGYMYHAGRGTPKDEQQALAWHRKAAEQGFDQAQDNLGQMCDKENWLPKTKHRYKWKLWE